MRPPPLAGDARSVMSKRRGLELFWLFGAPAGVVALLFAFGAHL